MATLPALLKAINQAACTKYILYRSLMFHSDVPMSANNLTQDMLWGLDSTIACILVGIESQLDHYCIVSGRLELMTSVHNFTQARNMLDKCPKPDSFDVRIDLTMCKMVKLMERKWRLEATEAAKRAHALC